MNCWSYKAEFLIFLFLITLPVNASSERKLWCMYTEKCKENVYSIENINDIQNQFLNKNFNNIAKEFNELISYLKKLKVKVFLGDKVYFPTEVTGVYTLNNNKIFLNRKYMFNDTVLIRTLRHEGWHVVQDCFAGLDNGYLNILVSPKGAPKSFNDYEFGAKLASKNKGMTQAALKSCYTNDNVYIMSYLKGKTK